MWKNAGIQVVEVQMHEVLLDVNNIEVVEVAMDDNNVEIVEVLMNGDEQLRAQVEVSPLYVIEEVSKYFELLYY